MDDVQELIASIIFVILIFNIMILLLYSLLSSNDKKKLNRLELPVSFAEAKGKLKIIGERLAFIDYEEPELSFGIERSNIVDLNRSNSTLIIQTREPTEISLEQKNQIIFRISKEKTEDLSKWLEDVRGFFSAHSK